VAAFGELATHLTFYNGRPSTFSAVTEVKRVVDERKIGPLGKARPSGSASWLPRRVNTPKWMAYDTSEARKRFAVGSLSR
jgi:hypothetical protein